jgi:CDP-diacylglycerol--glycerol-3-phosphate 3-phosphatidyltransferase
LSVAFNIPNTLTWFRIACIPLVVIVYYLPFDWGQPAAAWLFGAAAVTDGLDGYLARKLNQMSKFGEFLDPVADKVIVAVALLMVTHTDHRLVVLLVSAIIIGREITISALREWMAGIGARHKVAVINVAKYKTIAQMFAPWQG